MQRKVKNPRNIGDKEQTRKAGRDEAESFKGLTAGISTPPRKRYSDQ